MFRYDVFTITERNLIIDGDRFDHKLTFLLACCRECGKRNFRWITSGECLELFNVRGEK